MKILLYALVLASSIALSASSLTVVLEDNKLQCEIFINGNPVGTVKDSLVFGDIEAGAYKISMFSNSVFDEGPDSLFTKNDLKARKLGPEGMKEAVVLGTESVLVKDGESTRVIIKNRQVNSMLNPKAKTNTACCCLGGAGGCCLGVLAMSGIMVWLNNTVFAP